jgi:uncharacterized protein with beta-barrel porin domain
MCGSMRPTRARQRDARRSFPKAFVLVLLLAAVVASSAAQAQSPSPTPSPTPSALPSPTPILINADVSAGATVTDLGSTFLERLGALGSSGFGRALRTNPGGGGASEATDVPRVRTWGEAYGIAARNGPQAGFVGDHRTTWGGVAGLGAVVAPGVNLGISVDQSRTSIDVPLAMQSATLDLTQFGFNASVDKGPWTWAVALIHGFGKVNSSRDTGFGFANAGYNARIDGALTEVSYYWTIDQGRVVPKAALEYVRATTGSFQEAGGFGPLMASGATAERSRLLLGAEVGHYWVFDQKVFDLSAYGKFIDNTSQNFSSITVSLGAESISVQGIGESRYGADTGASASLSLSNTARLYLNYDARFRAALQSHQGTLGVELKF